MWIPGLPSGISDYVMCLCAYIGMMCALCFTWLLFLLTWYCLFLLTLRQYFQSGLCEPEWWLSSTSSTCAHLESAGCCWCAGCTYPRVSLTQMFASSDLTPPLYTNSLFTQSSFYTKQLLMRSPLHQDVFTIRAFYAKQTVQTGAWQL